MRKTKKTLTALLLSIVISAAVFVPAVAEETNSVSANAVTQKKELRHVWFTVSLKKKTNTLPVSTILKKNKISEDSFISVDFDDKKYKSYVKYDAKKKVFKFGKNFTDSKYNKSKMPIEDDAPIDVVLKTKEGNYMVYLYVEIPAPKIVAKRRKDTRPGRKGNIYDFKVQGDAVRASNFEVRIMSGVDSKTAKLMQKAIAQNLKAKKSVSIGIQDATLKKNELLEIEITAVYGKNKSEPFYALW